MCYRAMLASVALLVLGLSAQAQNLHWVGEPAMADDFFPIVTWTSLVGDPRGGREGGLESIAECNFTVAAFVDAEDLPLCEKLGLRAMVHLPRDVGSVKGALANASDEAVSNTIKQRIDSLGSSKAIIGYFIADEPIPAKFAPVSKEIAAVKKWAPGKIPYVNLLPRDTPSHGMPGFRGAVDYNDYLERFVAEDQPLMLSYGNYDISYSDIGQSTELFWQYIRNLADMRRVSLEHGIPFWHIACALRIRPYTSAPTPASLTLQAYATLASGARGIVWWRYHSSSPGTYGPIDSQGKRTDTWDYLRMVNRQVKVLGPFMNHVQSTGIFFSDPPAVPDLPPLPGRIVEKVESVSSNQGYSKANPPVMVGEFKGDDGSDYAMVVNLSMEKSANIKLRTRKAYTAIECISSRNGSAYPIDDELGHWLAPGQGVLIRFKGG